MKSVGATPESTPESTWHHVVVGVLTRPNEVLMVHRRADLEWYPAVWDFPGGHVEDGEAVEACLIRELEEELGVQVQGPLARLARWILEDAGEDITFLHVTTWSGEPTNSAPEEHDDLRWLSLEDAVALRLADPAYPGLLRGLPHWSQD